MSLVQRQLDVSYQAYSPNERGQTILQIVCVIQTFPLLDLIRNTGTQKEHSPSSYVYTWRWVALTNEMNLHSLISIALIGRQPLPPVRTQLLVVLFDTCFIFAYGEPDQPKRFLGGREDNLSNANVNI